MKITSTYLIGKHLKLLSGQPLTKNCALCGQNPDGELQGMHIKEVIGEKFLDNDYLKSGHEICQFCIACLGKGQDPSQCIRTQSFIATQSSLQILKRDEIWSIILSPPQEPFVFGVTFSHKKHISFKANVNLPGKTYQIQTENYTVDVKLDENLKVLMLYMQNWYSVNKDTSAQPTWFTKDEIKFGTHRYGVIEKYGIDEYLREDAFLKKYRGTGLLDLLTFLLNKGPFNPHGYALQKPKEIVKKVVEKKIKRIETGKQLSL